jgi:hypothetical protein
MEDTTAPPKTRKPWIKIPFEKGTPEFEEERRRRHREACIADYHRKKAIIKEEQKEDRIVGDAPPMPVKRMPCTWPVPADLVDVLGTTITLPDEWTTWPLFHVRRQDKLSKTTMAQYRTHYYRLPQSDIWAVTRFVMQQTPALQNMFAKAGLSYVCESLYTSIYVNNAKMLPMDKDYKVKLLKMMIFSILNKRTKKESYERHISQEASDKRIESTVPWEDWTNLCKSYLRAINCKPSLTEKEKKDALIIYVYSQFPPIRLNWNDIKVKRVSGLKGLKEAADQHTGGNVMYFSPKGIIVCWSDFKNAQHFTLPVRREVLNSPALVRFLNRVLPEGDSEPLKIANFSKYLSKLAEDITGKPFSNRLMRSSFIRWFHQNNDSTNVNAVKAMMKEIHQNNLEVHLAYIKHKVEEAELTD